MNRIGVEHVTKDFPAVRALEDVTLGFAPGRVHGLVGENGAGKSTLMAILAGLQQPTTGTVVMEGRPVVLHGAHQAIGRGVAMIHQELNLVDDLSVAENICLGREPRRLGLIRRRQQEQMARAALEELKFSLPTGALVRNLSIAQKQMVEIAKAVAASASVLIMDEPTAVLSEHEKEALFALIGRLRAGGITVIYISHHLAEVLALCDPITVLRDGRVVRTVGIEEFAAPSGVSRQSSLASPFAVRTKPTYCLPS